VVAHRGTVKETSSTTYEKGTKSASASAVRKGKTALVLGTTDSTTITATQVIVQPANSGSETSSKVIPFKPGAPSTSKQAGQIPANYKQGSGTIVSGTTANKATKAALAAYPGGHRRPCCEAEQRRVRGPQHRRQLAASHLRQPGLQGRRRRLAATAEHTSARRAPWISHFGRTRPAPWCSAPHSARRSKRHGRGLCARRSPSGCLCLRR
jgi:hypothetical protein